MNMKSKTLKFGEFHHLMMNSRKSLHLLVRKFMKKMFKAFRGRPLAKVNFLFSFFPLEIHCLSYGGSPSMSARGSNLGDSRSSARNSHLWAHPPSELRDGEGTSLLVKTATGEAVLHH